MPNRCEIHAVPGINLKLRQRWRFVAFTYTGVINLWCAKSEPFWSRSGQVARGEREQAAMRGLFQELARQGWRPADDADPPPGGRNWYNISLYESPASGSGGAQLIEAQDHWVLPIEGYAVWQCIVGRSFGLEFHGSDGFRSLGIESPFTYRDADGQAWELGPEGSRVAWAPALTMYGLTITRAVAYTSGGLDVTFTDGSALSVAPDPRYEAWSFSGPRGMRVISLPGGDLAIWSEQ